MIHVFILLYSFIYVYYYIRVLRFYVYLINKVLNNN